jgi:hypothetical protein
MHERKVILLEFNELTPALLNQFMAEGHIPNFKRFFEESLVYTTDAEEEGERLNPWIQWVTVHSGMSYDEHGIYHLNEGHKLAKQCVWDVLSAQGKRIWVCGSMNVRYDKPINGYVLPDPWTVNMAPYPENVGLEDFYKFVQTQVQEHTNESLPLTKADYARFLKFMVSHGLSAYTATSIIKQLAKERMGDGKWKRAVILDKLQFDVFKSVFRELRPHLSTFFLNSTAHMQHCYWRHMDPEPFKVKPTNDEVDEYGDAVLYSYKEMDKLVGKFLDLANNDTTLIFSTALSQQPCLVYEDTGGKRFYRPKDFDKVVEFAGITKYSRCSPVMSEQFHVYFDSGEDADAASPKLEGLKVNGRPLMLAEREEPTAIFTGAKIFDEIPEDAVLTAASGKSAPFYELFYRADSLKSGMHHPDGALWIRTPARQHQVFKGKVTLRAVAPTIVKMFGIDPPEHMRAEPLSWERQKVAAA